MPIDLIAGSQKQIVCRCTDSLCLLTGSGHGFSGNYLSYHPAHTLVFTGEGICTGHISAERHFHHVFQVFEFLVFIDHFRSAAAVLNFKCICSTGVQNHVVCFHQLVQQVFAIATVNAQMADQDNKGARCVILHQLTPQLNFIFRIYREQRKRISGNSRITLGADVMEIVIVQRKV